MAFDWNEYMSLAKALVDITTLPKEARLRTAISRAYYAAFQIAFVYFESKGLPIDPDKSKHASVIYMLSHGTVDQRKLGQMLDRLRIDRNKADYDAVISDDLTKLVQLSLKRAEDCIAGIGKLK